MSETLGSLGHKDRDKKEAISQFVSYMAGNLEDRFSGKRAHDMHALIIKSMRKE